MESILACNLRSRYFPDIQFSQNHIANYGASFKAQKVMLPSWKCQIFSQFTQLSRQKIQLSLCHFSVYMAKYPHAKSFKNLLSRSCGKCATDGRTDRQTDRQTDGQMNRTNFIGPLPQGWRFHHVFRKFDSKIFSDYLAWLWAIWK